MHAHVSTHRLRPLAAAECPAVPRTLAGMENVRSALLFAAYALALAACSRGGPASTATPSPSARPQPQEF
ncbi:MAG: hypothetical protein WA814_10400, partial [Candidatus Baltobacteraceae bacterium]